MDNAATEKTAMLQAADLTKQYSDGTLALNKLNFSIYPGQIYAMLGGNGAGKTTTINMFLNFIEPTSGEALVAGIASHKEPLKAKRYLAYVSERVSLYTNFNAFQNLDYFCKLGGKTEYTAKEYEEVLLKVGLQKDAHERKLRGYSKGMLQKCGLAIAILKDTPAILLDEPTSGLDPKSGFEFNRLLMELKEAGKAILMSTHDIFRAKEIADTVGIMKSGNLVMQQSADELKDVNLEEIYLHYMSGGDDGERAA